MDVERILVQSDPLRPPLNAELDEYSVHSPELLNLNYPDILELVLEEKVVIV